MSAYIKTLKNTDGDIIYPQTKTSAIYTNDGVNIEKFFGKEDAVKLQGVDVNGYQKFWRGTKTEYDALITKSDEILYIITDDNFLLSSEKGIVNGVASLDANGKIPSDQLDLSSKASVTHASRHAVGGSDAITPVSIGAATTLTLTVNVPVAWTASGSFFYQQISVRGMLVTDNPIADILPGSDNAANKLYAEAWSKVQSGEPMDGAVKLWATSAPTLRFPLQFKITRTGNETGQGKCILAGHPPVGGQIGYGTYTGDGTASRTISLGVTPKWVLCTKFNGATADPSGTLVGGLATANSPCTYDIAGSYPTLSVTSNGFKVYTGSGVGAAAQTNQSGVKYNYIYGI